MTNKEGRNGNGEGKETLAYPELTNLRIKKSCLQLVEQEQSSMSAPRKLYPRQEFKMVSHWEERGMKQKSGCHAAIGAQADSLETFGSNPGT